MRSRADEIRKRIAKRKKERERKELNLQELWLVEDEEKYGFDRMPSYEAGPNEGNHPLFRKEVFLFKFMVSACIVLMVGLLFRNQSQTLEPARNYVKQTMEKDFQFATVAGWYQERFGQPLAIFQSPTDKNNQENSLDGQQYALPASGRILEEFDVNGQRITIETPKDAMVEAMSEGVVQYIGEKEGFGKTVIIQHADKSETWYGNLSEISVSLYDIIEKEKAVGKVSNSAEDGKGAFYFAIKKDDNFVDPIQVIQFE